MQLSNATLAQLPASVEAPGYPRAQVEAGIVHLGLGAFHRAHQAMYTDRLLATGERNWGIVGAGVVSADIKAALAPQDGLYVLAERGAGREKLRVIGSIVEVLGGPEDAETLLARMSATSTRIVSLTVTEKGYFLDPGSDRLRIEDAAIAADLAHPEAPKTAPGLIVEALKRRRAAAIPPFTVLSCDNLPHNGRLAKAAVLSFAAELDSGLAAWIEANVSFPCTMVDRITPATTDADRARLLDATGVDDAWPVLTEEFCQWVIEDRFTLGRPDWDKAGAIFSDEIEAWENMKLQCLNGAHSCLAYLGQITGRATVAEAMTVPLITSILDQLWQEIREVLKAPQGVDTAAYVESLKQRFANPSLAHRTAQIASDGSQKLPQRLLAPLRERIKKGLDSPAIATALAAWMHYVVKIAHTPDGALVDPLAATILAQAGRSPVVEETVENLLAIESLFGADLASSLEFRFAVIAKYRQLAMNPDVSTAV
ncbi:mannitol dehydrogenase family protein [Niveibacterium terrae]|uniref:mannitol dehydrogenase family protein n=1 Tax=Niveibacterium terrae TaxID=3373598 RepID=UPI003A93CAE3